MPCLVNREKVSSFQHRLNLDPGRIDPEIKEKKLLKLREAFEEEKKRKLKENQAKESEGLLHFSFLFVVDPSISLSIAIPGAFLNNAQSAELRTYMAGQIARAATLFCVSEVIIYDETSKMTQE